MAPELLIQTTLLVVFSIDAALLLALVLLKVVHRRRTIGDETRRTEYLRLLSRHLSYENCTEPITEEMAEDPAFLDALIDMRNAIEGDDVATLRRIVNRHGVIERQMRHLDKSQFLGRRLRAAVALAELGDETSAKTLMRHLDDREPEIRIQCARGLGRIRWTPAIDQIVSRFSIEIPWVATRFSDTLVGYGRKATWPLLAYVRINHRFEGEGPALALRTIAQIRDDQAVGPLLEILDNTSNLEVKVASTYALGKLGSPQALPALDALLDSEEWVLRVRAASALGELGASSAIPRLVDRMRDRNWHVRRAAAAALAELPKGIEALYAALDDDDPFAADAAAEALADAGELVSERPRLTERGSTDDQPLAHTLVEG